MIERKIFCVECNKKVKASLVTGKEIYPHRLDLYDTYYYKCPNCGNYVGTHKGTITPLGCIPSERLRRKRIQVHNMMDHLWKNKLISRNTLYKLIRDELGYNYHNGTTTSIEECDKALSVVKKIRERLDEGSSVEICSGI